MWREICETPQMKRVIKVAGTVLIILSAYETLSDLPEKLARDKNIIVTVLGIIVGLTILIASYAFFYLSVNAAFLVLTALVKLPFRLIFRRGQPRTPMSPSASLKWIVAYQAIALALTVYAGIATHGHILTVFTYWPDKAEKDDYNRRNAQDLRECLNNPHNQSDIAKKYCYEMHREWK